VLVGFAMERLKGRALCFWVLFDEDGLAFRMGPLGSGWSSTPENWEPKSFLETATTPTQRRWPRWGRNVSCASRT
jgi:hypothetical protein